MKIFILCNDGSPLGITYKDMYGECGRPGIGGAESSIMTLAEGWVKQGNEVVLFNDPLRMGESPFEQRPICDYERDVRCDVLIVFRSPNQKIVHAKHSLKVWLSTDQYTSSDFKHFSSMVDKIVTISPHHSEYFRSVYGINNSTVIDLPVRTWDYEQKETKVPHRLIFTSVPDRGLALVAETFPSIKVQVPDASMVITSDYRLWGTPNPMNNQFMQMFIRMSDVEFLGAVPRKRLIQEQLRAQIHYYPFSRTTAEELFCIAAAESQVAGVLPITSADGALKTTNMGVVIEGNANDNVIKQIFIQKAVEYLQRSDLPDIQSELQKKAIERFSLDKILKKWDKIFK